MSNAFLQRHKITLASIVLITIGAVALVVFALASEGYPVRHVDLNDGGIWVTSSQDQLFGRLNKPAGSIDAAMTPVVAGVAAKPQLDVRQTGAAVVAWDQGLGKLYPVDVLKASIAKDHAAGVSSAEQVGLAGGTLAALDPSNGKIWAQRVDDATGVTQVSAIDSGEKPTARIELANSKSPPSLAVAQNGTVFVVSSTGQVVTLAPTASGFGHPAQSKLGARLESAQATAVGSDLVVLDASASTLVLPGGHTVHVDVGESAKLQAPSDAGSSVVVATERSLIAFDLGSGQRTVLWSKADGTPAQPTWLAGCVYGAWTGSPGSYVHSCDGQPAIPGDLKSDQALVQPVFRVNRNSIVLNDLSSGLVIDLQNGRQVDNWKAVKPPPISDQKDDDQSQTPNPNQQDQPPKAVDDTLGARPGRTTVLHVLDNDSDPQGYILVVSAVTAADDPNAKVAISPDGQTVQVTLPSESTGAHFKYTVDDGKGLSATANVAVEVHGPGDNTPPNLRVGYKPQAWSVAAGGTLSLPVIGDWRDDDGDPPVLTDAGAPSGTVTTTSDGRVTFTAGVDAGPVTVAYHVSDGVPGATPADGSIAVNVLATTSTSTTPPTAEPDIARGVVGQPITIRPLDNDLPGSDPTNPAASLAIAAQLTSPEGTAVTTDVKTGVVTLTGGRPGSFVLAYQAAFGNAAFSAPQSIRVDVVPPPSSAQPPVAVPDNSVLRGQAPNLVDVLANDFDPAGRLLVVTRAESSTDNGQLQIAIVQGHWLRINALTPALSPNPQIVRYTITDGVTTAATGEVTVTQFPALATDAPVPQDDYATVRAGDVVSVPVLDNDTNPGGDPISLVTAVANVDPVGELQVTPVSASQKDAGNAYVSGQLVRYVPPAAVATQQSVIVDYVASDPAGDQATGHLHVTIMPAPSTDNPDLPPTPQGVEARVTAGDRITIPVPTYGVDPEGDSVSVTGVGSGTALGRVVQVGASSITYEAFPTSAGTDTFSYTVTDAFDKTGVGTIQVAVVPPGEPQAPVAVDDQVIAAPGAHLQVDPLANDITGANDRLIISPGGGTKAEFPSGVTLASPAGPMRITAPAADGKPLVIVYSLSNGIGTPSTARITVRSQDGYNNPPRAFDATARVKAGSKKARVNVLAKAYDPDGRTLKVLPPSGATASGGVVTVTLNGHARNLPYRITDSAGATAMAVIHVPSAGAGTPYARPGATIKVDKDASTTVNVSDYVIDPAGKTVRLTTTDKISGAPAPDVKLTNDGDSKLKIESSGGYVGPAAANFEVTTGASLKDANARIGYISVPVQVGPDAPVVRCPADPIPVVEGGQPVVVDVASVCHVWVANPADLDSLKFDASWAKKPGGVAIDGSGSHTLTLTASGSASPGDIGQLSVSAPGSADKSTLSVQVIAAPPPTIAPVTIDGFKTGSTAKVDLANYVQSQLRDPNVTVVSIDKTGGEDAQATKAGSTVSITPGAKTSGVLTFSVVVSDVEDATRTDRRANGIITMNVLNVPDAPTNVAPGQTVLSKVAVLSWTAPKNNGAPIEYYLVESSGVSQQCAASPCTISGLTNGQTYSFTVKAHNLVGDSDASAPSPGVRPDAVPEAATGLQVSNPQDGTVTLQWTAAKADGTPVNAYRIAWPGGSQQVGGTSTTATPSGLNNDSTYTFTVIAVNEQGPGPAATVQGQSAGKPATPGAPTFTATNDTSGNKKVVVLNWSPVDPNGPSPTSYTVTRSGTTLSCASDTATTCTDPGIALDGTKYSYSITARNAAATKDPGNHTSAPGPATSVEATATPDDITGIATHVVSATPDGQAPITLNVGASHGATSTVQCTYSGTSCGQQTFGTGAQAGASMTLAFPAGWSGSFTLTACNGSSQSDAFAGTACNGGTSASVAANGPPNPPVNGVCAGDDGNTATFQWSAPGNVGSRTVVSYNLSGAAGGNTGATSASVPAAFDGQQRTINVYSVDSAGEQSAGFISITCQNPLPTISIRRGAPHQIAVVCTDPSCSYIHVTLNNFPRNAAVSLNCWDSYPDNGYFKSAVANTDGNGNFDNDIACVYGYPGRQVRVDSSSPISVSSNTITW